MYTTGSFTGWDIDFDPGTDTLNLTSAGWSDIFIQKLDPNGNLIWAKSMGGPTFRDEAYSITTDISGNIYTTGFFSSTTDFDPSVNTFILSSYLAGYSDIFILKLSQCFDSYSIDSQTACNSYTWIDGNTYTANNNTATHTLTNATGCDSVVTLNLTVLTPGNFTASITPVGYILTAQPSGGSYQWLDCDNNYAPIAGEINQSFTATSSGNYAAEVTLGSCTDTSDCESVTVVGLAETKKSELLLYPNPTSGILTIKGAEGIASVYDIYGRLVLSANTNKLDISHTADGIYFVRVLDEQGMVYVGKVLKE